jgi:hypothetical protein
MRGLLYRRLLFLGSAALLPVDSWVHDAAQRRLRTVSSLSWAVLDVAESVASDWGSTQVQTRDES